MGGRQSIVDKRKFKDRIIWGLGYYEKQALILKLRPRMVIDDIGGLMAIQTFLIPTDEKGFFLTRTRDLEHFGTWYDHYRKGKVPFLVVRENNNYISIYKERMVAEASQLKWNKTGDKLRKKRRQQMRIRRKAPAAARG